MQNATANNARLWPLPPASKEELALNVAQICNPQGVKMARALE